MKGVKIAIVEESYLIRKGLIVLLREFDSVAEIQEFESHLLMEKELRKNKVDAIIINHEFLTHYSSKESLMPFAKRVITYSTQKNDSSNFTLNDSKSTILQHLEQEFNNLHKIEPPKTESQDLSTREKLVLQQVSLGLQNKEIAEKLFISTHTVITHRKNITRKLGIKTVSGLTIYALLNKLVDIEDIKM